MRRSDAPVPRPAVTLRPATMDDAPLVFQWRNDAAVRAVSGSTDAITMTSHLKWFAARLPDTHPETIVMALEGDEPPVGTGRILLDGKTHAVISLVVAPDYRGRGVGRQIIKLLTEKIELLNRTAVARVQSENLVSLYAFMSQGFHIIAISGSFIELHSEKQ